MMQRLKVLLIVLMVLVHLAIAQPANADRGKFMTSPDYTTVTQAIDALLKAKDHPEESNLTTEELQQKMATLQFQKYVLETADARSQCANQTGKTIAVYVSPKKSTQPPTLYYLGDGQVTDDDFDCKGAYLPSGTKLASSLFDTQGQELAEPLALRVVDGTQLILTSNPDTGVIGLNAPIAQTFKAGEGNWTMPTLTSAEIEAQAPNAPAD
ncbi:MAG: hypothetical protein KME27_24490 [Lyngbya sp. HA4199-MV5]|nr:hypothetical protein [Lyngbya sp. HA4199-MV5]